MNVLVVDDNAMSRQLLGTILRRVGMHVQEAASGAEALECAALCAPDLKLLDVMMPEMDGFTLCSHFKQQAATRDVPVIFVSALDDDVNVAQGLALGAVDYIFKPFSRDDLLARVRSHLPRPGVRPRG